MEPLVRFARVTKKYGHATALHSLDLTVPRGKTTALIGPSGCGKSTILRLIIGLLQPDSGELTFDGQRLAASSINDARRRIGYVIQDGGLFPHLTARANVLLLARHLRRPEPQSSARLEELCALTRLPVALLDRYPLELSGGQRQRVSLMRALMLAPELLLLDEPLGALDPMVRAKLQEDLKAIFAQLQQTVVLVTHDLAEAAYLADHIVLLNDGRVVQEGTGADLRQRPASAFVTEFVHAQRSLAFA
jgi:osmoprotectant transport system ATP-binding protein